jgi:hypothetical protein
MTVEARRHRPGAARVKPGSDVRPSVYALAVERGWQLVELHREVLDLEGIFRKLTQVV